MMFLQYLWVYTVLSTALDCTAPLDLFVSYALSHFNAIDYCLYICSLFISSKNSIKVNKKALSLISTCLKASKAGAPQPLCLARIIRKHATFGHVNLKPYKGQPQHLELCPKPDWKPLDTGQDCSDAIQCSILHHLKFLYTCKV